MPRFTKDDKLVKGLTRIQCPSCGFAQTSVNDKASVDKCPTCGFKDLFVKVGTKEPKTREDFDILIKYKREDINMVNKYAKLVAEMKKLGIKVPAGYEDADANTLIDETTGTVGATEEKSEEATDSLVVEHSESGRGLSMYTDYSKIDSNKYKRLARD